MSNQIPHKLRQPLVAVAAVVALLGLASAAAFALPAAPAETKAPARPSTAAADTARADEALADRALEQIARDRFAKAIDHNNRVTLLRTIARQRALEEAAARKAAAEEAAKRRAQRAQAPAPSSGRCGGDLPPCCVMQRESGGNIHAQNPTSSASGKWQFVDGTWNGYGGYSSAAQAPESVQDAKARELWAGGAGAGHWGGGC